MAKENAPRSLLQELLTLQSAFLFALPLTVAQRWLTNSAEKEEAMTNWKAYDDWVRISASAIDNVYRNSLLGQGE